MPKSRSAARAAARPTAATATPSAAAATGNTGGGGRGGGDPGAALALLLADPRVKRALSSRELQLLRRLKLVSSPPTAADGAAAWMETERGGRPALPPPDEAGAALLEAVAACVGDTAQAPEEDGAAEPDYWSRAHAALCVWFSSPYGRLYAQLTCDETFWAWAGGARARATHRALLTPADAPPAQAPAQARAGTGWASSGRALSAARRVVVSLAGAAAAAEARSSGPAGQAPPVPEPAAAAVIVGELLATALAWSEGLALHAAAKSLIDAGLSLPADLRNAAAEHASLVRALLFEPLAPPSPVPPPRDDLAPALAAQRAFGGSAPPPLLAAKCADRGGALRSAVELATSRVFTLYAVAHAAGAAAIAAREEDDNACAHDGGDGFGVSGGGSAEGAAPSEQHQQQHLFELMQALTAASLVACVPADPAGSTGGEAAVAAAAAELAAAGAPACLSDPRVGRACAVLAQNMRLDHALCHRLDPSTGLESPVSSITCRAIGARACLAMLAAAARLPASSSAPEAALGLSLAFLRRLLSWSPIFEREGTSVSVHEPLEGSYHQYGDLHLYASLAARRAASLLAAAAAPSAVARLAPGQLDASVVILSSGVQRWLVRRGLWDCIESAGLLCSLPLRVVDLLTRAASSSSSTSSAAAATAGDGGQEAAAAAAWREIDARLEALARGGADAVEPPALRARPDLPEAALKEAVSAASRAMLSGRRLLDAQFAVAPATLATALARFLPSSSGRRLAAANASRARAEAARIVMLQRLLWEGGAGGARREQLYSAFLLLSLGLPLGARARAALAWRVVGLLSPAAALLQRVLTEGKRRGRGQAGELERRAWPLIEAVATLRRQLQQQQQGAQSGGGGGGGGGSGGGGGGAPGDAAIHDMLGSAIGSLGSLEDTLAMVSAGLCERASAGTPAEAAAAVAALERDVGRGVCARTECALAGVGSGGGGSGKKTPQPCPSCRAVSFCSEECRRAASGEHALTCPLLREARLKAQKRAAEAEGGAAGAAAPKQA